MSSSVMTDTLRVMTDKLLKIGRVHPSLYDEASLLDALKLGLAVINSYVPVTDFTLESLPEELETFLLVAAAGGIMQVQQKILEEAKPGSGEVLESAVSRLYEVESGLGATKSSILIKLAHQPR